MICHQYKTIFIHIPKTAGTSIESMFGKVQIKNQNYFTEIKEPGKHWTVKQSQEKYEEFFSDYYKWTVVRNPWEKELSAYLMMRNQVKFRHMSFKTFLKEVTIPSALNSNSPVFKKQMDFLMIDGDIFVDQIIRYEYLEDGWASICKKINKPYQKLNELRRLSKKPTSEYYDQECIDIVSKLRQDDINFLKYDLP